MYAYTYMYMIFIYRPGMGLFSFMIFAWHFPLICLFSAAFPPTAIGNRPSAICNWQSAIEFIYGQHKKLSKEAAIWAAVASIFANCWLVYLQDTLPLTPPALLFASILYLFFFLLLLSYPLLLLVRTLGRQFVNANAADRLRSRTVANWFSIQFMWHSHSYLDTWTYVHICMYKCTYMYSLINKLWSVCKKRKFPFFTKIFQLLN